MFINVFGPSVISRLASSLKKIVLGFLPVAEVFLFPSTDGIESTLSFLHSLIASPVISRPNRLHWLLDSKSMPAALTLFPNPIVAQILKM
jgi:hypothetical protein